MKIKLGTIRYAVKIYKTAIQDKVSVSKLHAAKLRFTAYTTAQTKKFLTNHVKNKEL